MGRCPDKPLNSACKDVGMLADVAKGGETAFPNTDASHWLSQGLKPNHTASTCVSNHVYAAPRAGDALLFYSLPPGIEKSNPEGAEKGVAKVDPFSMHTGCPPEEGLKWTATFWVHAKPFRPESYTEEAAPPLPDPALCADFHEKCKEWAGVLCSKWLLLLFCTACSALDLQFICCIVSE
jgi:prolyl 4-hydroxylase